MSLLDKLLGRKPKTAAVARDRLQIIIAQQRDSRNAESNAAPDYLPILQKELLEVLSKYVNVELNDIQISHERQDGVDMLELNIKLPENQKAAQS